MTSSIQDSLDAIRKWTSENSVPNTNSHSIDQTISELKFHFLTLNSKLAANFLCNPNAADTLQQIRPFLIQLNPKETAALIMQEIECSDKDKAELNAILDHFQTIASHLINTAQSPTIKPWFDPIPSLVLSCRLQNSPSKIFSPQSEIEKRFSNLKGEKLIEAIENLESDEEVSNVAKTLTIQQVEEIIRAESCSSIVPRLLVSLESVVFFQYLLGIDNRTARLINSRLHKVRRQAWFTEKFKQIREDSANISNKQAKEIDLLNRRLRKLARNDITRQVIASIDELKQDTLFAFEAHKRLLILLENIEIDLETVYLFRVELPHRYEGLLKRLSDNQEDQRKVSGCPYGILYRKSFEEYECIDMPNTTATLNAVSTKSPEQKAAEDGADLVSVICTWELPHWSDWIVAGILDTPDEQTLQEWTADGSKAFKEGLRNLINLDLASIQDLKRHRIFNAALLKNYIAEEKKKKREVQVDYQWLNPLQRLIQFVGSYK